MAEVLITLGVIGVVAAVTMPTLIANHQKSVTINKLKKVYTVLNQAFKLSENDNSEYSSWDKKEDIGATEFFNRYWKPYLNSPNVCSTYSECGYSKAMPWATLKGERNNSIAVVDNADDNRISFYLADGTFVSLSGHIYVDLNGSKGPNIYGKDFFEFAYSERGILPSCNDFNKSNVISRCSKNNNYDAACCSARIIKYDNWQIKDDYPW